ncbi:MAG: YqgE/AlgH family protein [Sphingobacteriaceae bacterium]|nr:YqgE/AlgH family protein [Sphingobacteriaceae bacterium]
MQGNLLVAHPLLNDGFFNRSVVLITSHNESGSLGFILNFITPFKLRDVRAHIVNGNFPIFEGGPVAKDQLFFLHRLGTEIQESIHIQDDLYIGGDFNELLFKIEHAMVKPDDVRFFVGYSGWGEGQLEEEIKNGNWMVNEHSISEVLRNNYNDLWKQKLEEDKKSLGIFADIGFNPSVN